MDGYHRPQMGQQQHPIDQEVRNRLRALFESGVVSQAEFARRSGVKQPWLFQYARGKGHATIDEVIRMAAVYAGVDAMPLTTSESELVRLCRGLASDDDREDLLAYARMRVRRRVPSKESSAPAARTLPATARRARGTRKAAGERG